MEETNNPIIHGLDRVLFTYAKLSAADKGLDQLQAQTPLFKEVPQTQGWYGEKKNIHYFLILQSETLCTYACVCTHTHSYKALQS